MNINRHNYETFFLLYVDKELSAAEAKAVEVFVDANADLKTELQMLQQAVIAPEAVNIDFKKSLLKDENITALQEKLLLFVDDELNAADKKTLQLELQKNAVAAAALNILQQTKLVPDNNIVFTDKSSLYRKEPTKVIGIKWWRIAAAAVIFGFGIWGATSIYNKQGSESSDKDGLASTTDIKGSKTIRPIQNVLPIVDSNSNTATRQANTQAIADVRMPKQNIVLVPKRKINVSQQNEVFTDKVKDEKENTAVLVPIKKETNNLPTPLENFNTRDRNKNNPLSVTPIQSNNARESQKDIALVGSDIKDKLKGAALIEPTNPIAKTAGYNEGDDNAVAMQDEQTKHSKFGGFLRKVKRIVERTTKIKTGDDDMIRVAGFDIAIK